MNLGLLVINAVDALSPYLPFVAKGAANEVGKGAIAASKSVYEWVHKKLGANSNGVRVLDRLVKDPASDHERSLLRVELEELLTSRPELSGELRSLVEYASVAAANTSQSVTGHNGKIAQIVGNDNFTIIG